MLSHAIALFFLSAAPEVTSPKPPAAPVATTVVTPEVKTPEIPAVAHSEKNAEPAKTEAPAAAASTAAKADPDVVATPPALSKKAFCGELAKTGRDLAAARKKLDDDRKALEGERAKLTKLAADIETSRAALRAETEHLTQMLAQKTDGPSNAIPVQNTAPAAPKNQTTARPAELDGLAKTMKGMKPEAAAALIQRTDAPLAAALLKRMKPNDAGAVMDKLKPDFAAELITLMATTPSAPSKGTKL